MVEVMIQCFYNIIIFRIEEERFKQAQLDVKPENAEHKAFRELEEMLKSGKLFPTDQVNPKD